MQKHFNKLASSDKINLGYGDEAKIQEAIHELLAPAKPGDLMAFSDGSGYLHSGILVRVKGSAELWIQSKLEQDQVVTTPIETISRVYDFGLVEVYRRK